MSSSCARHTPALPASHALGQDRVKQSTNLHVDARTRKISLGVEGLTATAAALGYTASLRTGAIDKALPPTPRVSSRLSFAASPTSLPPSHASPGPLHSNLSEHGHVHKGMSRPLSSAGIDETTYGATRLPDAPGAYKPICLDDGSQRILTPSRLSRPHLGATYPAPEETTPFSNRLSSSARSPTPRPSAELFAATVHSNHSSSHTFADVRAPAPQSLARISSGSLAEIPSIPSLPSFRVPDCASTSTVHGVPEQHVPLDTGPSFISPRHSDASEDPPARPRRPSGALDSEAFGLLAPHWRYARVFDGTVTGVLYDGLYGTWNDADAPEPPRFVHLGEAARDDLSEDDNTTQWQKWIPDEDNALDAASTDAISFVSEEEESWSIRVPERRVSLALAPERSASLVDAEVTSGPLSLAGSSRHGSHFGSHSDVTSHTPPASGCLPDPTQVAPHGTHTDRLNAARSNPDPSDLGVYEIPSRRAGQGAVAQDHASFLPEPPSAVLSRAAGSSTSSQTHWGAADKDIVFGPGVVKQRVSALELKIRVSDADAQVSLQQPRQSRAPATKVAVACPHGERERLPNRRAPSASPRPEVASSAGIPSRLAPASPSLSRGSRTEERSARVAAQPSPTRSHGAALLASTTARSTSGATLDGSASSDGASTSVARVGSRRTRTRTRKRSSAVHPAAAGARNHVQDLRALTFLDIRARADRECWRRAGTLRGVLLDDAALRADVTRLLRMRGAAGVAEFRAAFPPEVDVEAVLLAYGYQHLVSVALVEA